MNILELICKFPDCSGSRNTAETVPYKEIVTQFNKSGFYTFYNKISEGCAAHRCNKICMRTLSKLEAFALQNTIFLESR